MWDPEGSDTGGGSGLSLGTSSRSDFIPRDRGMSEHARSAEAGLLLRKRQKWNLARELSAPCPEGGPRARLSAEVPPTLFDWQVWREERRFEGASADVLVTQDEDGDTILHVAVAQGRRAAAHVLAAKMATWGYLDLKEHNGQTALQIAAATDHHLIVRDLLTRGARLDTWDLWGRSPLHVCAEKGHFLSLQSMCRTLTGRGLVIDVDLFSYSGLTPLHVAVLSHNGVLRELETACERRKAELLRRGQAYVACAEALLLVGASFGTRELKSGRTCLHMASEEANVELLSLFLDRPLSRSFINVKTFSGNTALHVACSLRNRQRQQEAVKVLVRGGAKNDVRNVENEVPSQLLPGGAVGQKVRQVLKGTREGPFA